jgi:hypothetical protein
MTEKASLADQVIRPTYEQIRDSIPDPGVREMWQAAFRLVLAFDVLVGRMPRQVEKRFWNRALETPVLIDVLDWTDDRRIFSVLVWPPVESSLEDALEDYEQCVKAVKQAIARGANEMAWSTHFETDYGLRWDHERQVWTAQDGFAYDGQRSSA